MTVRGPTIFTGETGVPSSHFGWGDLDQIVDESLTEAVVAVHLFGTDFPPRYGTDSGITDQSTGDYGLNENNLTNAGATPGAKSFTSSTTAYYTSPLTGDALLALETANEFSVAGVSKFTAANGFLAGCWNGSTVDGWGIGFIGSSGTRYGLSVRYAVSADPTDLTIIPTAGRGTDWDFIGATFSATLANLYQQSPGGLMKIQNGSTPMTLPAPIGGLSNIRIGRSVTGAYTGAQDAVCVLLFNRELSAVEMQLVQTKLKTFLAGYSITI